MKVRFNPQNIKLSPALRDFIMTKENAEKASAGLPALKVFQIRVDDPTSGHLSYLLTDVKAVSPTEILERIQYQGEHVVIPCGGGLHCVPFDVWKRCSITITEQEQCGPCCDGTLEVITQVQANGETKEIELDSARISCNCILCRTLGVHQE